MYHAGEEVHSGPFEDAGLSTLSSSAVLASLLANSLSSPLPRHEKSDISLHDLASVQSFLLGPSISGYNGESMHPLQGPYSSV